MHASLNAIINIDLDMRTIVSLVPARSTKLIIHLYHWRVDPFVRGKLNERQSEAADFGEHTLNYSRHERAFLGWDAMLLAPLVQAIRQCAFAGQRLLIQGKSFIELCLWRPDKRDIKQSV